MALYATRTGGATPSSVPPAQRLAEASIVVTSVVKEPDGTLGTAYLVSVECRRTGFTTHELTVTSARVSHSTGDDCPGYRFHGHCVHQQVAQLVANYEDQASSAAWFRRRMLSGYQGHGEQAIRHAEEQMAAIDSQLAALGYRLRSRER